MCSQEVTNSVKVPSALYSHVSADLVPESALNTIVTGVLLLLTPLGLPYSQTAVCTGNWIILTGSLLRCGAGRIHPLIAGIITNDHQVLWLPFHPPSLTSSSWVFVCRMRGRKTDPPHALAGYGCSPRALWGTLRVRLVIQRLQDPAPSLGFRLSPLRTCRISASLWYASVSPEKMSVARVAGGKTGSSKAEVLNCKPAPPLTFYVTLDRPAPSLRRGCLIY